MNPWKIIGWIVLAFLVVSFGLCGLGMFGAARNQEGATAEKRPTLGRSTPTYSVHVEKVECVSRGRDKAEVTITNNGPAIPYAKAYFEFVKKDGTVAAASDSYFSPTTVPSGARASADSYSSGSGSHQCRLVRIQDGDGNPVTLL